MRHLSAILFIVLLVTLPSCKFFGKKRLSGKNGDTMTVWKARQDSIRVVDSIKAVQAQILAEENAKLEAERKAAEEKANNKYNIIVGSFITPDYAKRLADEYEKKGYKTSIIKMEGSTFELVSAEALPNLKKAVERQKELQNTVEKDAWIYIAK